MAADFSLDEMVHLYADGELPFEQHAALFAQLAADAEARLLLESIMQFRRMSRQEGFAVTPAMDAAFMQRLARKRRTMPRTERAPARRSLWQRRTRLTLRSATLLALMLLLVGFFGARPTASQAPQPVFERAVESLSESPVVMSAQYVFSPGVVVEADR